MRKAMVVVLAWALVAGAEKARACDNCSLYCPKDAQKSDASSFQLGLVEQWTHYDSTHLSGVEIPNELSQYLNSSSSRLLFGWQIRGRIGVQANLPVLYRSFRRAVGGVAQKDSAGGVGDLQLLANYRAFQSRPSSRWQFQANVLGGVKLPTGKFDIYKQLFNGHDPTTAVHPHYLVLGSGSWDAVVGMNLSASQGKTSFNVGFQSAVPVISKPEYKFGADFNWFANAGRVLISKNQYSLALRGSVSGEFKATDSLFDLKDPYTKKHVYYAGPSASLTFNKIGTLEAGVDWPLSYQAYGLSVYPDYRLRVGFLWQVR